MMTPAVFDDTFEIPAPADESTPPPATGKRPPKTQTQTRFVLANMIIGLVRSRNLARGHHLTEKWLADELSVSRTPVRAALRLLADRGIVDARERQGFFLAVEGAELDTLAGIAVPSTPEQAFYATLIRERMARRLPDSITQTELAQTFRVNRVVLLRTLSRMADEGLIERNRGHGWRFLPCLDSFEALGASYAFRLILEPAALMQPGYAADATTLDRLEAEHRRLLVDGISAGTTPGTLFGLDASFHEALARFSRNPYFVQAVQQQNRLRRLMEYRGAFSDRQIHTWVHEHLAVLNAVRAGNQPEAARMMKAHLENAQANPPETAGWAAAR